MLLLCQNKIINLDNVNNIRCYGSDNKTYTVSFQYTSGTTGYDEINVSTLNEATRLIEYIYESAAKNLTAIEYPPLPKTSFAQSIFGQRKIKADDDFKNEVKVNHCLIV